jgi:hypothetical protein
MTNRSDCHATRTRLRMVVTLASVHGWAMVCAVVEV